MIPGNANLWKGIYIEELAITLPPQFTSREDESKRISFITHNMLFDENGISGIFEVENILAFGDGSAGGWPFSVERFSIELLANNLNGAGFGGKIALPIAEQSPLVYDAIISPGNEYLLNISKAETMKFSVWAAEAELLPNSYVQLKVEDGRFQPEAMLSGSMSIKAGLNAQDEGETIAELKGIHFRKMHLKTESPYFMVESLGYDGDFSLKGFPLSISKIALETRENEAALCFNGKVLLGFKTFAIGGDTRFEVVGGMKRDRGFHSWKYDRVDVSGIKINSSFAEVFSMTGSITLLNDDSIYGDGFAGDISLKLNKCLEGIEIKARAIFGKKDFRYWFVDGSTVLGKTGIPVFPPLNINGIGGGAYYKMAQRGMGEYVPDEKRGFGFKAAVMLNIGKPDVIGGEASFEIAFNDKGGLAYMGFFGQVEMLSKIPGLDNIEGAIKDRLGDIAKDEEKYLVSNPGIESGLDKLQKYKLYQPMDAATDLYSKKSELGKTGFMAAAAIQYDFNQDVLHATFDLYVNSLGGLIKGRGQNNNAGASVLHIEKGEWYMHMGTPTNRLGIEMDLLNLVKIRSGAYFMTGSKIEDSPPPPSQVADILGVDIQKLDYMRDLNLLSNGGGFAFGSDFSVSTGDITFLILYANFQTGLGFDIMLKDYGEAQCKGHSGPVGINGWYANGQAYAYMQGEAGVNLNLLFIKKKIPIIKAGAATLFQAKLPNPAWFSGHLGVKFDLLGGMVRGDIRMKITFGEECELVNPGGSPLDFPVISEMKPDDQMKDIDVFAAPQVAFNMPIGKSFEFEEDGLGKSYRLTLDEFTVSENGKPLQGRLEWNVNKDAVSFYSHDILPPETELKANVIISFEEWQNGCWQMVYTGGLESQETKDIRFTTGTAPDNIPLTNVQYCYPVKDQKYFLAGESSNGYVQLKKGQPYLFTSEFSHEVWMESSGGEMNKVSFNYNEGLKRLSYTMPAIEQSHTYKLNVIVVPKNVQQDLTNVRQDKQLGDGDNDITVSENTAVNVVQTDIGKVLLPYKFASSHYRTFVEKMDDIKPKRSMPWVDDYYLFLQQIIHPAEPFDLVDLKGTVYSDNKPLLNAEATLEDDFYTKRIGSLVYKNYPYGGLGIEERDVNVYGVPPIKAIFIDNKSQFENNSLSTHMMTFFPFTYNLYEVYASDYYELRNKVVNKYMGTDQANSYKDLMGGFFPAFPQGKYDIRIKYTQPDNTSGSSSRFYFKY